jgi:hypothetical protein
LAIFFPNSTASTVEVLFVKIGGSQGIDIQFRDMEFLQALKKNQIDYLIMSELANDSNEPGIKDMIE